MSKMIIFFYTVILAATSASAEPIVLKKFEDRGYYIADLANHCDRTSIKRLILAFHGFTQSATEFASRTRFHERAGCSMVVYPVGLDEGWNTHRMPRLTPSEINGIDDIGWLTRLAEKLKADAAAVGHPLTGLFLTGISNGGRMAYALACHAGASAVGVVATTFTDSDCLAPSALIPLKHVHGLADTTIPWSGDADDPAPLLGIERWRIAMGCDAGTLPMIDGSRSYQGCEARVEYRRVAGMGHAWPRPWDYDATAHIIEFFRRF